MGSWRFSARRAPVVPTGTSEPIAEPDQAQAEAEQQAVACKQPRSRCKAEARARSRTSSVMSSRAVAGASLGLGGVPPALPLSYAYFGLFCLFQMATAMGSATPITVK